eukprot:scaffold73024_cov61-Attheya_sp.AAC.5
MVDPATAVVVVVGKAAVSAANNGWSFAKAFDGAEPNSAILAKVLGYASSNGLYGGAAPGPICADSPLVGCLYRTLVGPTDRSVRQATTYFTL